MDDCASGASLAQSIQLLLVPFRVALRIGAHGVGAFQTHAADIAAWSDRIVSFRDGRITDDRPAAEVFPAALREVADQAFLRREVSP